MGFSQKAQKVAQGGMRFLFAPQLGVGFKPVSGLFTGFVKLIAEFMAGAKLLPATHPALHPATAHDARLGEVLAVSYASLRRPGARVDQYFVFAALVSLLGLITIMSVYTVGMLLFSGGAHAGFLDDIGITFDINVAAPACTFTGGPGGGSTSYFTVSNENCDMAQQWINVLVLGKQNWVSDLTVAAPVGAGLAAMFSTYSSAMLVLGGFLVLYHMLAIVAGTAHEGKMGGRAMNHVWAPIRLVMAIGLLVPVGVNGLNSGQLIVTQVAKWGSALASNIWVAFADSYAANSGTFVIAPPVPDVKQAVGRALDILICKKGFEWAIPPSGVKATLKEQDWIATPGSKTISKTWDYVRDSGARSAAICGFAAVLDPGAKVAASITTYVAGVSFSFGLDLRGLIIEQQKKSFENLIKGGGTLDQLAQDIFDAGNGSNSNKEAGAAMANKFNKAVYDYQLELGDFITSAIASSQIGDYKIKDDAMGRGWMSASVWFNTIARYNAMVLDYSKQVPAVFSTYTNAKNGKALPIDGKFLNNLDISLATSEALKQNLARLAASDASGMASNWAASDDGDLALAQKSGLDAFLDVLMNEYKRNLGSIFDTDAKSDISVSSAAFSSLRLGTANPLAELSSVGLRLITIAKSAITKMQECSAEAAKEKKEGSVETSLGCKAGGDLGPAYFIVSAAVGSLIAAGVTLGYMLPLLPFIRFMFGVLTWVMALFETVIAIPVVALGHIKMDGEGLSGPMARGAYLLLMQLFLRPTLMVFGLIAALLIFNLMIVALNEFYTQAVAGAIDGGSDSSIAVIVYTVIYGSLAYAFANASFKAIDMIPNQCLHWIGGQNLQTVDESHRVTGAVAQTSGLGGSVAGNMTNMASRRIAQQTSVAPTPPKGG